MTGFQECLVAKKGFVPFFTRTLALVGHRSAGKTSLGDLLLHATHATRGIGRVDEGTSLLDHTSESRQRRQTTEPGHAWLTWRDHLINVVDLPGAPDLWADSAQALRAVDAFLLVVAANSGLGPVTRRALDSAEDLPGIAVLQQIDRPHDMDRVVEALQSATERKVLPLQLPFFDDEGAFAGVLDLPTRRALRYDPDGTGAFSPEPLPARLESVASAAWERVVEAVALADEDRLERYLEFLELPEEEILAGLAEGVRDGSFLPVLLTSAALAVGAEPLLDAVVDLCPPPAAPRGLAAAAVDDETFLATVLHTTIDPEGRPCTLLRVWSGDAGRGGTFTCGETGAQSRIRKFFAIRGPRRATAHTTGPGAIVGTWDIVDARAGETLTRGERMALPPTPLPPVMVRRRVLLERDTDHTRKLLRRAVPVLLRMDGALELEHDPLGDEIVLAGRTDGQLERAARWLVERMGVPVRFELPRVGYREAPIEGSWGVEGVHRREVAGLVEEYGRCCLDLTADADCTELDFQADVEEDLVPRRFLGAVEDGLRTAARSGPLAGYPVVGARVTCVDGQYDMLCSTEDHFHKAAESAMRSALETSGTRLLEPWQTVTVHAPSDAVGAILSDLTSHRGRILDVRVGREAVIEAHCPEREVTTLSARLGALTGGRAWFEACHSHYDVLPEPLVHEALRHSPRGAPARGGASAHGPVGHGGRSMSVQGVGASG